MASAIKIKLNCLQFLRQPQTVSDNTRELLLFRPHIKFHETRNWLGNGTWNGDTITAEPCQEIDAIRFNQDIISLRRCLLVSGLIDHYCVLLILGYTRKYEVIAYILICWWNVICYLYCREQLDKAPYLWRRPSLGDSLMALIWLQGTLWDPYSSW